MRVQRTLPLAITTLALLAIALVGCEPTSAPDVASFEKPKPIDPGTPAKPDSPRGNDHRAGPGRPLKGTFKSLEPVWVVSHFAEQGCNGLVAGAEVESHGNVSHLGRTEVTASAAWDWAEHAAGDFEPEGPTTNSSATILSDYPYDFCSQEVSASGTVVLVAANGDELHGIVSGGEVYELAFERPGDGQEQFVMVTVDGGTGRFKHASGEYVIHTIVQLLDQEIVASGILPGGRISY